jgi:hypothetical protein
MAAFGLEKVRVGGLLFLVPEGYECIDDENGYTVIIKQGTKVEA